MHAFAAPMSRTLFTHYHLSHLRSLAFGRTWFVRAQFRTQMSEHAGHHHALADNVLVGTWRQIRIIIAMIVGGHMDLAPTSARYWRDSIVDRDH